MKTFINKEELLNISSNYYSRKDIQKIMVKFSKNREIIPRYYDFFGKRPDTIEYENDIKNLAMKGATSFHSSEELWLDPLKLTEDKNRIGWDLIIDIDSKYLDYAKVTAKLILEVLSFHNVKNIGMKFSGGSGIHLGIAAKAFPKYINEINIKDMFPDGPRFIASYIQKLIEKPLRNEILNLSSAKEIAKALEKNESELYINNEFNPFSVIELDTILISPRHLFRMPYSLHERTGLVSVPIKNLSAFNLNKAKPENIEIFDFLPEPEENEAKELIMQALDKHAEEEAQKMRVQGNKVFEKKHQEIIIKDLSPELYPPCIKTILQGVKQDGRKRALFILLNFFTSLKMEKEKLEKEIQDWNKKNYQPLKEGYIKSQLSWYEKQKALLPPNCEKDYYKALNFCSPDFLCSKIKNPINYVYKKNYFRNKNGRIEN